MEPKSAITQIEKVIDNTVAAVDVRDNIQIVEAIYEAVRSPKYPGYTMTFCEKLLADRDAAILREAAERAVKWYLEGVADDSKQEYAGEVANLRAAIEGKEKE